MVRSSKQAGTFTVEMYQVLFSRHVGAATSMATPQLPAAPYAQQQPAIPAPLFGLASYPQVLPAPMGQGNTSYQLPPMGHVGVNLGMVHENNQHHPDISM